MFVDSMYINPAILTLCITILMALIVVGSILWRLATTIGDVKKDVAVVIERLDGHIKACGPLKS